VNFVNVDFWPHNTTLFVTDFRGNDPRFVAYLLRTLPLADLNSGSAQPSLNRNFIYPVRVRVPPIGMQRRIASILSAYDDLIENNTRRIAILEEMARRLFDEWFVQFRFPGHDTLKLVNTQNGQVPEGWAAESLGDYVMEVRDAVDPASLSDDTHYVTSPATSAPRRLQP
jgi:type I restriction enzyme S subunit